MRSAFLLFTFLAMPAQAADADALFFPMKIGTQWTYRVAGQEDRMIVTAVKEEKVGAQACVRFERKLSQIVISVEQVAILEDGCYRLKSQGSAIEPAICFLKASAKKGDTWKQEIKIGDAMAATHYELDVEDVVVPAGMYSGALVVRAVTSDKGATTKATAWYAKGIGMVKQTIEIAGAQTTLELEKVEIPRK